MNQNLNTEQNGTETARCAHAETCGGCRDTGVPYEKQLAAKHEALRGLLGKYGEVSKVLPAPAPVCYRNKVVRSFENDMKQKRRLRMGIYSAGTRRVIPISHCMIEDEGAQRILQSVKEIAEKQHIPAFDPHTGRGVLRHALVRAGRSSGEYLLTLVTGSSVFAGRNNFLTALRAAHPELTTVVQNVNDAHTGMILGDPAKSGTPDRVLFGAGYIRDTLCGNTYRISAHSFYQVDPAATEVLYRTAVSFADIRSGETVFDAYCGIGSIGMTACRMTEGISVIGVESNPDAVRDAIANAKENRMRNIRFFRDDAGHFLDERADLRPDVVFLDPPRTGSDEKFLSSLCRTGARRVVYVSCSPETLARDLAYLTKFYRVEKIQPVDMFPMTEHVETVVLMSRDKE